MNDTTASMESSDTDSSCRVCRLDASLNIYNANFDTVKGEVRLADAFESFSIIRESPDQTYTFPNMVCYECTNQLIAAYQFLLKVKEADQLFIEQLERSTIASKPITEDENLFNIICTETGPECLDGNEAFRPCSPIQHIHLDENEMAITKMQSPHQFDVPDELLQTDDTTSDTEECILNKHVGEKTNGSPNGAQTKHTESLSDVTPPRRISTVTSHEVRQVVAAAREAKRRKIVDAEGKRVHLSAQPFVLDKLVVPQFVITELSTASSNQVKSLEVDAVRISLSELMELNLSEVAINDADHPASPTSVFMCKYCPKAFATSYHLIVHTRKSHLCQFCLKTFEGSIDLNEHTRTQHLIYDCPLCPREFPRNSNLRSHIKQAHSIQLPPNTSLLTLDQLDSSDARLIELQDLPTDE